MKKIFLIIIIAVAAGFLGYSLINRPPKTKFIPSTEAPSVPQFSVSGKIKSIEEQSFILETQDLSVKIKTPFEERPLTEKKIIITADTTFKKISAENETIKSSFAELKPNSVVFALSGEDITLQQEFTAKEILLIENPQ